MPVLESPIYHDWPVSPLGPQRYGYIVWLRLDPEASVSLLEDEQSTRAAALLPRDWFLGFVLGDARAMQYNSEHKMLLSLGFALLGEGPSDIEAHSIPIAPAPPYSDKRPAVELSSQLPWPNLYVHTHVNAGGIVCRVHTGTGRFEPVLSEDTRGRVYRAYFADTIGYQNAKIAASHPEDVYAVAPATGDEGSDGECDGTDGGHSSEESVKFDTRSIDEIFDRVHGNVEVWVDPASHPGPPTHPDTWLTTLERLRAIWNDWRDRRYAEAKTRGPRKTDAWLQGVDAAIDFPHDEHDAALEPPLDDDAVLPEDAVDYRIEQEYEARSESTVSSLSSLHSQSDHQHEPAAIPSKPAAATATQSMPDIAPAVDQSISSSTGQGGLGIDISQLKPSASPLSPDSAPVSNGVMPTHEENSVQSPPTPAGSASSKPSSRKAIIPAAQGLSKVARWPIRVARGAMSNLRTGFTRLKGITGRLTR